MELNGVECSVEWSEVEEKRSQKSLFIVQMYTRKSGGQTVVFPLRPVCVCVCVCVEVVVARVLSHVCSFGRVCVFCCCCPFRVSVCVRVCFFFLIYCLRGKCCVVFYF